MSGRGGRKTSLCDKKRHPMGRRDSFRINGLGGASGLAWGVHGMGQVRHGVGQLRDRSRVTLKGYVMNATVKMNENQMVKPVISDDGETVTFHIADGGEPLVLNIGQCHPAVVKRAAAVGMAQVRIVDAAAVSAECDGRILTRAERMAAKRERMARLVEHYNAGSELWSPARERGEGGPTAGAIIAAVAAVKGWDVARTEREVDAMAAARKIERPAMLRQLAKAPSIIKKMAELRAERAPVDGDDLINELG